MATIINCMFNCKLVNKMHFNLKVDVKFESVKHRKKKHPIVVTDKQSSNIKHCFVGENPKVYIVDYCYGLAKARVGLKSCSNYLEKKKHA